MKHLSADDLNQCGAIRMRRNTVLEEILREVSAATGIPGHEICGRGRTAPVARARQVAYYAAWQKGMTLQRIGAFFGRDHTTVGYGIRVERERRAR
jgi:chromosomal replication initiation ATPase DnaA